VIPDEIHGLVKSDAKPARLVFANALYHALASRLKDASHCGF
jgi:hypothetical protein